MHAIPENGEKTAFQSGALIAAIGNTPLLELDLASEFAPEVRLFAKLEGCNPGGSIKDRPVARMVTHALEAGYFEGGRRLLDSSSGNAGIAYAMIGAALGVPVTMVVPGNASRERLERIAAHGAELIITDPMEGYDHALREARHMATKYPDRYWHCDQYANENNWKAHYYGTGVEILNEIIRRTGMVPDAFVAGVGTGGTLTGVGRRLHEAFPNVHIAAVIPERFPGIEGLKPMGAPEDIVPSILDDSLIIEQIPVTLEQALSVCEALSMRGVFVGPSSGAYVHAALALAETQKYQRVVTILSDGGERYFSTGMWQAQSSIVNR